ncbi:MAG: hypothetical protein KJ600_06820 [Nanoarchaeota archaeon]|nr:hypothetical protein [Nanoarchaeota archaeon]
MEKRLVVVLVVVVVLATFGYFYFFGDGVLFSPSDLIKGKAAKVNLAESINLFDESAVRKRINDISKFGEEIEVKGEVEAFHYDNLEESSSVNEYFIYDGEEKHRIYFEEEPWLVSGDKLRVFGKKLQFDKGNEIVAENYEFLSDDEGLLFSPIEADLQDDVLGVQTTVVLLYQNPNHAFTHPSASEMYYYLFRDDQTGFLSSFFRESSYGKTSLDGFVYGWFDEDESSCASNSVPPDATARLAEEYPGELSEIDRILIVKHGCGTGGGVSAIGKIHLTAPDGTDLYTSISVATKLMPSMYPPTPGPYPGWYYLDEVDNSLYKLISHELSHGFGIGGHGNIYDCGEFTISGDVVDCAQYASGDRFQVLGTTGFTYQPELTNYAFHHAACHKERFGWLDGSSVLEVTDSGTYTIYPYETQSQDVKAIKIPLTNPILVPSVYDDGVTIDLDAIYIQYQRPLGGYDSTLEHLNNFGININGILIRGQFFYNGRCITTYLFDAHTQSLWYDEFAGPEYDWYNNVADSRDSFLLPGETFYDPYNNIYITPIKLADDGGIEVSIINLRKCSNGIDDDNDGATDYPNDFSCSSPQDNDETYPQAECQDGIDNDDDGYTDYPDDFSCSSPQDNDEAYPQAQCQDGIDNDNDGFIDYPADSDCYFVQDNTEKMEFFTVKNNQGEEVAKFAENGDIFLEGDCFVTGSCAFPVPLFQVKNSAGETVSYVDQQGNLCTEGGNCGSSANCDAQNPAFTIKNGDGIVVIEINQNGELCFVGSLNGGLGPTILEPERARPETLPIIKA